MNYEIKSSPIEGLGVFATTDLKKNEFIFKYYGEEITWKVFKERYGEYKDNSLNCYPMRRIWRIIVAKEEPYKSKNVVNFINEGTTANVVLKNRCLFALREIKNGEEFLLKYPKDYKRDWL